MVKIGFPWILAGLLSLSACSTTTVESNPKAPITPQEATNPDVQTTTPDSISTPNDKDQIMNTPQEQKSIVYMTTEISPQAMVKIYNAMGVQLNGNVAVKLSTGEAGNNHYLKPELIKDLVDKVHGTIVESNTAYGGSRGTTEKHRQTIALHGFDKIANVDILDEDGSLAIPVTNGKHLKENLVGAHLENYDSILVLSHFKGHAMGGFGGALKNISIGIASSEGKSLIHSAGKQHTGFSPETPQNDFLESMAEASQSVIAYKGPENMVYINVMNNISVDCDCDGNPAAPDMHDIGILASTDPVALDKACVDLIYHAKDGASVVKRMERQNGPYILDHAVAMGIGSKDYTLKSIDL